MRRIAKLLVALILFGTCVYFVLHRNYNVKTHMSSAINHAIKNNPTTLNSTTLRKSETLLTESKTPTIISQTLPAVFSEDQEFSFEDYPSKFELPDSAVSTEQKRLVIKYMVKHAYSGYQKYAFGFTSLNPVENGISHTGPMGAAETGAQIIDALDTLLITGLKKEYDDSYLWLKNNFIKNFTSQEGAISVFEICIRFLGGLLSAHGLTPDSSQKPELLKMAITVADILKLAVTSEGPIPRTLVSPGIPGGNPENYRWAPGACAILADSGTLDLEFKTLSKLTGDPSYKNIVDEIRVAIKSNPVSENPTLYGLYITANGKTCSARASIGAMGDSFYEYLVKSAFLDKSDNLAAEMSRQTIDAIEQAFVQTSKLGNPYLTEAGSQSVGYKSPSMEHLACFVPGILALATKNPNIVNESDKARVLELRRIYAIAVTWLTLNH